MIEKKDPGKKRGFYGATGIIAGGTFLSRILGLVREQVFASFFGAGAATDAFQIAFRIPNLLRDLFAEGAMSAALIPTYTKTRQAEGEDRAWRLVSNVITALFLATSLAALLGVLFADSLVALIAPAFREVPGKHEMTVTMTQILWPFLPLVVMAAVWMGILNARERYATPALAPTLFNLASILAAFTLCPFVFWAFGWPPIYGMALGALIGGLLQWLIQVPTLRGEGFRFNWRLQTSDPALKKMVLLMGAGTFGLAATQVNVLVNSFLASGQGDGAVSWLNYAFRLMQFPLGVFGVAISTANLTKVAREAAVGDMGAVSQSVTSALRMVVVLSVPSAVGLAVLGIPIISVIYEHGRFHADDTYNTSMALAGYALGLAAYSAIKVLVPVLYSLGRARSTIWSSGVGVVLNVGLGLLLVGPFGFVGLAFATSIAAILNFLILLWILRGPLKQIDFKALGACFALTLMASVCMAIIVYTLQRYVGILPFSPIPLTSFWAGATFLQHLLFLAIALLAALVVYCLIGRILGLREIEQIQGLIWKRLKRTKDTP
jgi:putative peptidoglycan lipid II flippase